MLTEDFEKLAKEIAAKIEKDVESALVETQANLDFSNLCNGTTSANGFKFGEDEASDFISELMIQVADEIIRELI
ncbi:hypothetical protein ACWODG_06895 [Enterococcus italicus]